MGKHRLRELIYGRQCEGCGVTLGPRQNRFCSTLCANRALGLRGIVALRGPGLVYTCKHCGIEYKPRFSNRKTFCSRECFFAWKHAQVKPKIAIVYDKQCPECGQMFTTRMPKQLVCSPHCRYQRDIRTTAFSRARKLGRLEPVCSVCGITFAYEYKGQRKAYCSDLCQKQARQRASKQRQLRKRGVSVEPINPIQILQRDKWKCHICGCKTPKNLRGTIDPRAPELDHIIPLAQGGAHAKNNIACACRSCNNKKGARGYGQLRLIG